MNQKQIFTEYWRILDDFEDYVTDRFSRGRTAVPQFKMKLKVSLPADPHQCTACSLHEHNELRASLPAGERRRLLIVNRALPRSLAEEGRQFSPEERVFVSKWLEAIGISLDEDCAVISRICCPVSDPRNPGEEALSSCFPYLERIMKAVEPDAVLQLGMDPGTSLAGKTGSIPHFITCHPSDVLIDESLKRPVWEALKRLKEVIG